MAQAATAPGTVAEFHPSCGIAGPVNLSGVQAAGERPEAFTPCSFSPSQMMAKASLPRPLLQGSTTVSVIAVAIAASTALPPFASIESPACAPSGCAVATTFRAITGMRREG